MTLPHAVRVIERGWLNCNQVVLRQPGDNTLVDSGYCTHRERTLELVAAALEGEPLERLINTHCHSDHMGGNAALASAYGCRVTIPVGEAKHVDPWTPQSEWMERFGQRADPFRYDDTLAPGDTFGAGGLEWKVHAAPGHDMDALMFFEPRHRILISGDALWENGMGFVWPLAARENPFIDAALEALARIDALAPEIVIPGHGAPFGDATRAVGVARARLNAFAADPARNARHVVKVMFIFSLLERGSMRADAVPGYLARVPIYGEMAGDFLGMDIAALAQWMVADLLRTGALMSVGEELRPTMAA